MLKRAEAVALRDAPPLARVLPLPQVMLVAWALGIPTAGKRGETIRALVEARCP